MDGGYQAGRPRWTRKGGLVYWPGSLVASMRTFKGGADEMGGPARGFYCYRRDCWGKKTDAYWTFPCWGGDLKNSGKVEKMG